MSLNNIADKEWEVFIIGGGIFGAATARDAALRGFKTALVEKNDFASGTSSKSTKLIHGGIRYLEQLELGLVHECLKERTVLLTIAPHLVRPLPFLIPVFEGDRFPLPMVQFGTWIYDQLAGENKFKKHRGFSAGELRKQYPFLKNSKVKGGIRYFDAQMDDIRLCLETLLSAESEGASIGNHIEVTRISVRDDGKFDIFLRDQISKTIGTARALSIVNAAGPWADQVLLNLKPKSSPMLSLSKGVHLIVKQKVSNDAVVLSSSDKRIIFIVPWHNGSLIGTTDTPYNGSLDQVAATREDVDFLLAQVKKITGGLQIKYSDIITTFAGIRNLAAIGGKNTAKISRAHLIHENVPRFFSVVGGKYTTHRLIGEEVCDRIEKSLERRHVPCKTHEVPLIGSFDMHQEETGFQPMAPVLNRVIIRHFMETYGSRSMQVAAIANRNQELQRPLCTHHAIIGAQIVFSIEYEHAKTLMDVGIRRVRLDQMLCRGLDCVDKVADIAASRLNWTSARKESEILEYQNWVRKNLASFQ